MKRTVFALAAVVAANQPVFAQSNLGMTMFDATLSQSQVEVSGEKQKINQIEGRADFRISEHHGVQFDLAYTGYNAGDLGHLGGHIYMVPQEDWKYGVFGSFSDFNDYEGNTVALGFEALHQVSDTIAIEGRFGLGMANPDNMDFIFASGATHWNASDNLQMSVGLSVTDIDELAFQGLTYDLGLTATWHLGAAPLAVTAGVGIMGVRGRDQVDPEPVLSLGLSYQFGDVPGKRAEVRNRMFTRHDPLRAFATLNQF